MQRRQTEAEPACRRATARSLESRPKQRLKGAKGKSFRSSLSSNKNFCGRVVINPNWQRWEPW